jgi:hypothetical protein
LLHRSHKKVVWSLHSGKIRFVMEEGLFPVAKSLSHHRRPRKSRWWKFGHKQGFVP